MSDHEQLELYRRYLRRMVYGLAVLVLAAAALAVASLVVWQRHQAVSAVAFGLGVSGVVAGVTGAVLIVVASRSHPWPVVDPAVAVEAHQTDGRIQRAATLAVVATVCVAVGFPLVWAVYGIPAG